MCFLIDKDRSARLRENPPTVCWRLYYQRDKVWDSIAAEARAPRTLEEKFHTLVRNTPLSVGVLAVNGGPEYKATTDFDGEPALEAFHGIYAFIINPRWYKNFVDNAICVECIPGKFLWTNRYTDIATFESVAITRDAVLTAIHERNERMRYPLTEDTYLFGA